VKHLLDILACSQNTNTQRDVLNSFISCIQDDPIQSISAQKQGAIRILQQLERDCYEHKEIVDNVRYGLALLGYPGQLKSDGIRILSIDGGGIRGIVVMELLKRLEELTKKRIFELFDFICGTSNGAIIICGLAAQADLTLVECVNRYKNISNDIFNRNSTMDVLSGTYNMLTSHAYYDVKLWENYLKKYMGYTKIIETSKYPHCPKFCCVSTTIDQAIDAYVFRNYEYPYNVHSAYEGSSDACLWEVVRASSAAPGYFGDFILHGKLHQDGGILFNNPAIIAVHEAKLLWPNQKIQCLVSFGTGRFPNKRRTDGQKLYNPKMLREFDETMETSSWNTKFRRILEAATDTEQTHHILSDLMKPGTYFRFNPYLTEMVKMIETRPEKIAQIESDALMYYRRNEDKFEQAAEKLLKKKSGIKIVGEFIAEKLGIKYPY
jgi:calcium-independent phospholipase A2-gamma